MGFLGSLIFNIILFSVLLFVVMQLFSFYAGTKSAKRQRQRDLRYLRSLINEFKDGLIPFEESEFKLLSTNPVIKKSKRTRASFSRGVLSTIYQEPLIAFSFKESFRDGKQILLAQSDKNSYQLSNRGAVTEAFVDDVLIGIINDQNEFFDTNKNKIAGIQQPLGEKYAKIFLHDKDTAHINVKGSDTISESERVFSLFHDFKHEDSEEMVLLTLYYLFFENKAA